MKEAHQEYSPNSVIGKDEGGDSNHATAKKLVTKGL